MKNRKIFVEKYLENYNVKNNVITGKECSYFTQA